MMRMVATMFAITSVLDAQNSALLATRDESLLGEH